MDILRVLLSNRKQSVGLNGQVSTWTSVNAGILQGSALGSLLSFIYINDLSDNLSSNVKLFADNTSLFSVIHDITVSVERRNWNLKKSAIGIFSGKRFLI